MIDRSLAQIPVEQIESIQILIRADSAGAVHDTADHCHDANLRFSFGYELSEQVRDPPNPRRGLDQGARSRRQ